jgi:hypothetical protein
MIGCPPQGRRLQAPVTGVSSAVCNATKTSVKRGLSALQHTLSQSCQDLIRGPSVTCFSKVECSVDHVSLWNATNDTQIQEYFPWTGGVVCSRHQLTFQAEINFDQDQVTFALRGATRSYTSVRTAGTITGNATGLNVSAGSFAGLFQSGGSQSSRACSALAARAAETTIAPKAKMALRDTKGSDT